MTVISVTILLVLIAFIVVANAEPIHFPGHKSENYGNGNYSHRLNDAEATSIPTECSNFYSYVCNSTDSDTSVNPLEQIRYLLDFQLDEIFENYEKLIKDKFEAANKVKVVYDSCRKYANDESPDFRLKKGVLQSIGSFPALETNWSPDEFDFVDVIIKLSAYGVPTLVELRTVPSFSNPGRYIFWVGPGKLTEMSHGTKGFNRILRQNYYPRYFRGYNLSEDALEDIMTFHEEIVKVPFPHKRPMLNNSQEITFKEFKNRMSGFDWDRYFIEVYGHSLSDSDSLILTKGDHLYYLLQLFTKGEPRILANFLMSTFIQEFTDAYECVRHLKQVFSDVIIALYLQSPFYISRELEVTQLFDEIKDSALDVIRESSWWDAKTKAGILEKISNIDLVLSANGSRIRTEEFDARYKNLNVTEADYFGNIKAAWTRNHKLLAENLEKQNVDPLLYTMDPMLPQATYMEGENKIVISEGLIHKKFFNPGEIKVGNFARLGYFIGHGFAYALDPQFRFFDPHRRYHEWWDNRTIEKYERRVNCLEMQFNNLLESSEFTKPGLETFQENFADNVGLRIAYNAFQRWLQKYVHTFGSKKPDMAFWSQVFFMRLAKTHCTSTELPGEVYLEAGYSPPEPRLIGNLRNFEAFSEAFDCPMNSPMNPRNKCLIL